MLGLHLLGALHHFLHFVRIHRDSPRDGSRRSRLRESREPDDGLAVQGLLPQSPGGFTRLDARFARGLRVPDRDRDAGGLAEELCGEGLELARASANAFGVKATGTLISIVLPRIASRLAASRLAKRARSVSRAFARNRSKIISGDAPPPIFGTSSGSAFAAPAGGVSKVSAAECL